VLVPELRRHLETYTAEGDEAHVFTGRKGVVLDRSNFHSIWSKARGAVGRDDLHLHDLRHFGATLAAQAGATTKELMGRLGHSSPRAALIYQHATKERDQALAARMDALITPPTRSTNRNCGWWSTAAREARCVTLVLQRCHRPVLWVPVSATSGPLAGITS
jgi:Phage integrase family